MWLMLNLLHKRHMRSLIH